MALNDCVIAFILTILCSNPILKGSFITLLNGLILQLDQEITVLILQAGRFNIASQFIDFQIQLLKAIIGNVVVDLNLFLEPFKQFPNCPELANLQDQLQAVSQNKVFASLQKALYEAKRLTDVKNIQDSIIKKKEKLKDDLQEMLDSINSLCP